eukprot:CAMPEP_0179187612 /NCGR_PEP_ID=MMETSP0796-20121207/93097_1 /TAXON_ID=73915 /ORGANISM="Pyrodinium bahamense, Strain pbaha01" /LENGTH=178 /DNA_ID=CAMNT_0020891683 /DNA_START=67 /DNA_END=599 /DNA_ORIENTATION=+
MTPETERTTAVATSALPRGGVHDDAGTMSLVECQDECKRDPGCHGMEYEHKWGRCEIWLTPLHFARTAQSRQRRAGASFSSASPDASEVLDVQPVARWHGRHGAIVGAKLPSAAFAVRLHASRWCIVNAWALGNGDGPCTSDSCLAVGGCNVQRAPLEHRRGCGSHREGRSEVRTDAT